MIGVEWTYPHFQILTYKFNVLIDTSFLIQYLGVLSEVTRRLKSTKNRPDNSYILMILSKRACITNCAPKYKKIKTNLNKPNLTYSKLKKLLTSRLLIVFRKQNHDTNTRQTV